MSGVGMSVSVFSCGRSFDSLRSLRMTLVFALDDRKGLRARAIQQQFHFCRDRFLQTPADGKACRL